ncbi:non-ribosomal peptide synthetase [Archangium lansingense]|uniref:Amino acid adenylation domain-containing protein n=1 Tax=Archangium lansingense TaxID=2995310 RepID=A0ABT4ADM7_9BACT|nr:non-ribosomal peptide synthetase [Archangium lansinium]MCY1079431.1 amino acid adenylation domain-containing protein [Archangium lansinium]
MTNKVLSLAPVSEQSLVFPASFAQERLWFLERLKAGTAVYNMPVWLPLPGPLSPGILERCLGELVRRHESLRTTFATESGRPVQVVSPPRPLPLATVDLRRFPQHERQARLVSLAATESRRPFDIARGPLLRATLYRLSANDHFLLLVLHHLIADAWSIEGLVRELGQLYAAFNAGEPSPLEPLALQYADWACWQRERLDAGSLDVELAFWRAQLAGAPTVLDLSSARARPAVPSYLGGQESFVVDAELTERLRALSQRHGCSLYMTLLAAFATVLSRHAAQADLLIGSPVTNRNRPELESIIGLFVNTVVLRVNLRGTATVSELLEQVRAMVLDVHAHAEVPLERILEAVQPERSVGRHPLFQVFFSFQKSASPTSVGEAGGRGQTAPLAPPTTGTSKFDLSLLMTDTPHGLAGAWEYSADLFDAARILRLNTHFNRILAAFVESPHARVSALTMMEASEEQAIIAWEGEARNQEDTRTVESWDRIHDRVVARSRLTPNAVAVEAGGETVTFAQLVARATALSERLRARGIRPEERVGVLMRRNANLVVSLLGVLQAGAAYVPLDPTHPRERLGYIATDAGLTWVVSEEALAAYLPPGVKPLFLDQADDVQPGVLPPVVTQSGNLAYVLYTSGTTGRPKGVAVPHGSVTAMLDWAEATFDAQEYARVLASTSICFDISVFELFLPLTQGGTIVLVDNILTLASPEAPDVTLINTVPSAMRELLRLWRPGPSLRTVNLAGEPLARDLVQRLHERAPGVIVNNLYGPTETTVYSTGIRVESSDPAIPPIGRPIDGTVVYVLDERLSRVPVGVPGELYITGAGVARGYLGNPAFTAERYVPDPFLSTPGARMYRTGDLVFWRTDGALEYRGRIDHQVKLRGQRLELGEIESALREHPRVRDAVVVLRDSPTGDARLIAYVTADAQVPDELDALARRTLPPYMVPSQIVFLDELPRTTSGKVDRAALPRPAQESAVASRAPRTETEATLCQLFAEALGTSGFDPDGDFFALGGHSLLATGVVASINELLGIDLPLSSIFQNPTPARLSELVTTERGTTAPQAMKVKRRTGEDLPLAFAQEGMWFYDRLRPKAALYNMPVVVPSHGPLDHEVLQRSVDYLLTRHEALRTCFVMEGGKPVQRVVESVRVRVVLYDLSELPIDEGQRRAGHIMERETQRPFDLRRAPLLRAALVRLSADEQYVIFVLHHIIADGWSTDILLRDLASCYEALLVGGQPTLTALPLQYGDYVLWQRSTMSPAVLKERIAYFREHLAGAPTLISLPTDRPRPAQPSFRGGLISFELGAEASATMANVAGAHGVTAHMAYLATFAALLHQYSGQDDVVLGIPMANRSRTEWREVIGLFTNTVPIRLACGGEPTFAALLGRVRKAAVGAYSQEDVPFDRLVQELSPTRELSHHPIFQVLFGFQELASSNASASADVLASTGTAKFDLSLNLSRAGNRVFGVLEYATDLFDRASMERVARHYARMVEALATEPNRSLDTVAPLDTEDRAWCEASKARASAGPAVAGPVAPNVQGESSPTTRQERHTEARTDVERQIAAMWAEALGHSEFGMDQSFFEVGGHSLAAILVIVQIAEKWGVDLPYESIFTTPTIEALARAVESAPVAGDGVAGGDADASPELRGVERAGVIPLSFAQERLWFLDQLAPGLPVYNISFPIALRGPVDIGALERSLERLGDRHECLRAHFVSGELGPEQVFDPIMTVALAVTDLSSSPPAIRAAEAERLVALEARRYFDLVKGPMLRAHLLRMGATEYVLLLTVHHIVADARSVDILQRDLAALYESERTGLPDDLPTLPVQYADFAIWQRASLQGDRLAAELAHWKKTLAGAPSLLALPTDKPRPAEQNYAGRQLPLSLGVETSAAIRRLASEEQATPFMVLLAVFGAVLSRWGGTTDVVVGTPVIGRPQRELQELIGFFSNTLPLRMDLGKRSTYREVLRHVREAVIEAFAHQDLPFEMIVQALQPQRTLAHNPIFQVMFAFQRPGAQGAPGSTPTASSSPAERDARRGIGAESGTAKFDLTLFMVDETERSGTDDTEFYGALEYRTDLFEATTIERLASHIRAAAEAAAAPDAELSELFGASPSDRSAIERWNATTAHFKEREVLAHELCADQAARTPSAPAVSSSTESWSYTELIRRASRLARRLRKMGVGPDSRVAISAEPSPHVVVATLGVWMAGGACVPLDPSYPATRLSFMAENSGARWLVGASGGERVAPDLTWVNIDQGHEDDGSDSMSAELWSRDATSADQLAYVVYTSGSTGRPKGVAMTHRVLVNLVLWQRSRDERGAARRTLQFASPSFDVFFQELLLCLATGGEFVVAGPDARRDPDLLIDLCRERRIERLFLPFVALRALAEAGTFREPLADLREVITAGEQLQVTPALRRWFSAHPSCRLFNQYGPSETHVVTEEALAAEPTGWSALPPIGRPVANARVYVLDGALQPLPVGVPGDLYLGGLSVARGYLDQPALSAERFLPDPHAEEEGARMYRSGDCARWLPDGRLEFLGRSDDQVKIRGYRVEVAEVETVLAKLPGVRQAVVTALPAAGGDLRLVGYILSNDPGVDPAELRQTLYQLLPEPFVPAVLVLMDEFPRTPSGKVDRRALQPPSTESKVVHEPGTDLERVLASTWCDVLGLQRVGRDEDFFALGGHSLTATRVTVRLRERLAMDVPVRWIFEHPTIARLASALTAARPAETVGSDTAAVEIQPLPRDRSVFPSSFAQERLWFVDRMVPGNPAYNLTGAYALPASLDVEALRHSLDDLVRRHEALRTVFEEVDGLPFQVVNPAGHATLETIDLSYLPAYELDAEARRHIDENARRSFDLAAGPLFRATLLNLGSKGYLLLLAMHHIVSDGWSMKVLHRDLISLYKTRESGHPPSLPPLRLQYADFASWQRSALSGKELDDLLAYWRTHLAGAPHRLELPTDRPRSKARALRGATHSFELDAERVLALREIGRSEGATLFMTVLAVYLELIRRHSGQDDFLVGTPIGARPHAELEDAVGLFVNTLVLRSDFSGAPSFRALLRRVREETVGAYSHAALPFDRLVEELRPRRDLGWNPLIQVAFGLHHAAQSGGAPGEATAPRGHEADPLAGNGTAKFELSLVMTEVDGRLMGVFEYAEDLFEAATVERMAAHLDLLARQVVQDPDVPLSHWDLLSESQAPEVLDRWGRGPRLTADVGLAELVNLHARREPTRLAVEGPDGTLDYAELDTRASRLAERLRALGVTAEVRVGVCLGNSVQLPVALIAILRAGGVYVPLDPALPAARLLYLVGDAGVKVLITDQPGAERLGGCGARIIRADALDDGPAVESGAPVEIDPDQIAYIVYTSGSTGQPKGVMVTHRGFRSLLAAQSHVLGLGAKDRVLKFATLSFDASVFEVAGTLAAGATLCLEPQDQLLPSAELVALLQRRAITMVTLTPSSLGVLPVEACPALRLLFVAGEACPAGLVERWAPGRRMINGYGPTETTVWATFAECVPDGRAPAIGGPVANAHVSILDRNLRPVPVGIPGELFIGGPAVARGYLGRPDLTAASFLPDPRGAPGSRMYRTGDLARWRADENIEFLGRVDGQIKLRGVRIEPSEVEATISAMPGVAYCVAMLREDRPGHPNLVAYIVPSPSAVLDGTAIRRSLQERLPRYLVPSRILICDELPRTPSGKLDRQALPPPPPASEEAPPPPRGSVEEAVCRICSEVLETRVGRDDNFFELGGHSLLLTRILSRIRAELGLDIPVRRMFEAPTLGAFCEGREAREAETTSRIPIVPRARRARTPTSNELSP